MVEGRIQRDPHVGVLERIAPLAFLERQPGKVVVRGRMRFDANRSLKFETRLDALALIDQRDSLQVMRLGIVRVFPRRAIEFNSRLFGLALIEERGSAVDRTTRVVTVNRGV